VDRRPFEEMREALDQARGEFRAAIDHAREAMRLAMDGARAEMKQARAGFKAEMDERKRQIEEARAEMRVERELRGSAASSALRPPKRQPDR